MKMYVSTLLHELQKLTIETGSRDPTLNRSCLIQLTRIQYGNSSLRKAANCLWLWEGAGRSRLTGRFMDMVMLSLLYVESLFAHSVAFLVVFSYVSWSRPHVQKKGLRQSAESSQPCCLESSCLLQSFSRYKNYHFPPSPQRSLHGSILDHVTHPDDSFPVGNGPWLNKERMAATNPKIWARRRKQILLSYIRQSRSALNTPRHCSTLLSHIFQAWEDPRSQ
jgi:hypothetical protein